MSNNETKIEKHFLVFHDADQDGYCAANIVYNARKSPKTSVELVSTSSNIVNPIIPEDVCGIYFVDLCPSLSYTQTLLDQGVEVCIIDHHKSSVDTLEGFEHEYLTKVLDVNSSACMLAWNHFNEKQPVPWVVAKIHEWDKWEHADPQVIPFHYGLDCLDHNEKKLWKQLLKGDPAVCTEVMRMGHIAGTYYVRMLNKTVSDYSTPVSIGGNVVLLCSGKFHNSYEFAGSFNPTRHDAIGWWYYDPSFSGDIVLSVKTDKEGVDCLEILKEYNPVGGKLSASAAIDFKTIDKILKED